MTTIRLIPLLAAVLLACPLAASAQKTKQPAIGNFAFWAGKGDQKTGPYVPGLNAVLQLTDEQISSLHAAVQETVQTEDLQASGRKLKGDANATQAEREAHQQQYARAQAKLQDRVAAILTAEQKALIEKINAAYADAQKAGMDSFSTRFANVKGKGEDAKALQTEFQAYVARDLHTRLTGILSADQRGAMAKVAEAEAAAAEAGKNKVKVKN